MPRKSDPPSAPPPPKKPLKRAASKPEADLKQPPSAEGVEVKPQSGLRNPRYELFAQLVVTGVDPEVAYERVGYKANGGNARRLLYSANVAARIAELQHAIEHSLVAAEIHSRTAGTYTKIAAIAELHAAYMIALEKKNPGGMISAVMGKAKIAGLLIDRHLHAAKRVEDMTPDEILAFFPDIADELGADGAGSEGAASLASTSPMGRA